MSEKAIQDYYPEQYSHCYCCGRSNKHGLQIKSYWDGDESVCHFRPQSHHLSVPGFVSGGLIASLIDCHGTGTAAAARHDIEDRIPGIEPPAMFVTASLHVDYLAPAPIDAELELRGRIKETGERKMIVAVTLSANGQACASGEVTGVLMPDSMKSD
jgi:acyl-coenzyme A thioesterase PaaI-like protein